MNAVAGKALQWIIEKERVFGEILALLLVFWLVINPIVLLIILIKVW